MGRSRKRNQQEELSWGDGWDVAPCRASTRPAASVQLPVEQPILPPGAVADPPTAAAEVSILREDNVSATMLTADPLLSTAECAAWIAWAEGAGFELQKHAQTAHIAHRDNGRLAIESADVAAALFERLRPLAPAQLPGGKRPVGCNPNIRLYKYEPGQRFGRHVDQAVRLPDGSETEFTLLVYLNDEGLEGGETMFYEGHGARAPTAARIAPRAGTCLLHAHGERCLTHEGAAVTRGVKYLLRSDLAYG